MRTFFLALTVLATQISLAQITHVPTGPDLEDFYARLSASVYVVKGRTVEFKGVGQRPPYPKRQIGPSTWEVRIEDLKGGTLFTVAVDQVVCRESDFAIGPTEGRALPNSVNVFVPRGELSWQSRFDSYRRVSSEYLLRGREYLLFLRKAPAQEELVSTYQLDPEVTYYRTVEGDRGAVALPDATNPERPYAFITPLVEAVTTFCGAVKAPDADSKIRNLNAVREKFSYPAWRESVDAAVKDLERQRIRQKE